MGETKVQGCEEKERVLLLWERALTLFYENDTELFVAGAQERTIAGKIAMHMDKIYREIFPMPELVIDIEYNRMDTGIKPKYPGSEDKKKDGRHQILFYIKEEVSTITFFAVR